MKTDSIKLLRDLIIAKRLPPEAKTKGGIIIPIDQIEEKNIAKVLQVGPGRISKKGNHREVAVKVGQTIIFERHAFLDIDYNGEKCIMVREDKVMGVLE